MHGRPTLTPSQVRSVGKWLWQPHGLLQGGKRHNVKRYWGHTGNSTELLF